MASILILFYNIYDETGRVFPDSVDYGDDIYMPCFARRDK